MAHKAEATVVVDLSPAKEIEALTRKMSNQLSVSKLQGSDNRKALLALRSLG